MTSPPLASGGWLAQHEALAALARRQLFFVGGAPRSGTTWVQSLLNHHPDVSCRGEALFQQELAGPLERVVQERRAALLNKNATTFRHTEGYPPPDETDLETLLGTAVLLALARQCAGQDVQAVGEKTPENTFLFPRLKRLFPTAKFIGIARDPRDSLSSAWHFWGKPRFETDAAAVKTAFIQAALPAVEEGLHLFADYAEAFPADCRVFTYETLIERPGPILAGLFRLLDVSDDQALVAACVEAASFSSVTGGRTPGQAQDGAFYRRGVVGDWQGTLPPDLADAIVERLAWAYEWFGWRR